MTRTAAALLIRAQYLLLDFDGPICRLFANVPANHVADRLRDVLRENRLPIPAPIFETGDPLAVLRHTAGLGSPTIAARMEIALRDAEVAAAASATPAPFATEAIRSARGSGRRVAIVSNNSADAVHAYLYQHGLHGLADVIVGRSATDPARMKPDPWPVQSALAQLGAHPRDAVLIGDSPSDVDAAHAAGVAVIGYANRPGKWDLLCLADAVVGSMAEIQQALVDA